LRTRRANMGMRCARRSSKGDNALATLLDLPMPCATAPPGASTSVQHEAIRDHVMVLAVQIEGFTLDAGLCETDRIEETL